MPDVPRSMNSKIKSGKHDGPNSFREDSIKACLGDTKTQITDNGVKFP